MTTKDLRKLDKLDVIFHINYFLMKLGNKHLSNKEYQKCISDVFKEMDKITRKNTPSFIKKSKR